MKLLKRKILPLLLVIACALSLLPAGALAAGKIDVDGDVTLSLNFAHEGKAVSDVPFALYRVASVDAYGEYTLDGDFQNYPVQVNGLDDTQWQALAETLTAYVQKDGLTPADSGKTDENGALTFPAAAQSLKPGLYLVVGKNLSKGGYLYRTEPFLVALPGMDYDANTWVYDVTAEPKHTRENVPVTPDFTFTTTRKAIKVWEDDVEELRPAQAVVYLLKDGAVYDTAVLNDGNNWRCTWQDLPEYNDDGTLIDWRVTEEAAEGYTVLVSQEGITFTVTNTGIPTEDAGKADKPDGIEGITGVDSCTVVKRWDDQGYESSRPDSVSVTLYKNDTAYDTQVLSEENGWQFTWDNLPEGEDGETILWTLKESDCRGYVSSVSREDGTFVVTNSIANKKLPQTGVLWWPVPLLVLAGLAFLICGLLLKRKNAQKDDHE